MSADLRMGLVGDVPVRARAYDVKFMLVGRWGVDDYDGALCFCCGLVDV
jgi:hypothetical protein